MKRSTNYPGTLERRGAGWRWSVRVAGTRHRILFRVETREEAIEAACAEYPKLLAKARRYAAGAPGPLSMSELFAEFEELDMPPSQGGREAYRDSLRVLVPYFVERLGDPRCDRVTGPDVVRFLDWRATNTVGRKAKRKIAPRTVAKDRAVLHTLFERAVQRGYCEANPVAATKVPKARDAFEPVILSDNEFEKLLAEIHHPVCRVYATVLAEGGFRSESEALYLQWGDVDFDAGFIHVVNGATATARRAASHDTCP